MIWPSFWSMISEALRAHSDCELETLLESLPALEDARLAQRSARIRVIEQRHRAAGTSPREFLRREREGEARERLILKSHLGRGRWPWEILAELLDQDVDVRGSIPLWLAEHPMVFRHRHPPLAARLPSRAAIRNLGPCEEKILARMAVQQLCIEDPFSRMGDEQLRAQLELYAEARGERDMMAFNDTRGMFNLLTYLTHQGET